MRIKRVLVDRATRLHQSPPDILSTLQSERRVTLVRRADLIDLGSFTWPIMFDEEQTPRTDRLRQASGTDFERLKEAIVDWMARYHGVKLNNTKEIYIGGSLPNLMLSTCMAFLDPGDIAFVPELAIPMYRRVIIASGGEPVSFTVSHKESWLPRFDRLQSRLGTVARLLLLNSPHNPTGVRLAEKQFAELIWLAARENIIIVNDASLQSLCGSQPVSILAVEGGAKVGIELYSLSHLLGLPDLPFGFAVGNRDVIAGLYAISQTLPTHIPAYWVDLAVETFHKLPSRPLAEVRRLFEQSSAKAEKVLENLGLERVSQSDIPFIWAKITRRRSSLATARLLYRRGRVLVAPGSAFGVSGEGYLRFSLTAKPTDYQKAAGRLKTRMKLLSGGTND